MKYFRHTVSNIFNEGDIDFRFILANLKPGAYTSGDVGIRSPYGFLKSVLKI